MKQLQEMSDEETAEEDESTLVQLIFQKERTEAVDFEVAFTALLATGTFATLSPESPHRILLQSVAGLLLVVTVLRRMAIVGRFAREERVTQSSQQLVEFLALLCIFQILGSTSTYLCGEIECILPAGFATLILAIGLVIGMIVIQHLLYRDYFVFWGATFYAAGLAFRSGAEEGSFLRRLLFWIFSNRMFEIAYQSLKNKIPPGEDEELEELREFVQAVDDQLDEGELELNTWWSFLISGVPMLLVFTLPIVALAWLLSTGLTLIFLAFIAVASTGHIIKFLYLAYGSPTEHRSYSLSRQFLSMILYVGSVLLLFI